MKIEVNSTNMASWADGEYASIIADAIARDVEIEGKKHMPLEEVIEYVNNPGNFKTPQIQMFCILNEAFNIADMAKNFVEWKPIQAALVAVAKLIPSGAEEAPQDLYDEICPDRRREGEDLEVFDLEMPDIPFEPNAYRMTRVLSLATVILFDLVFETGKESMLAESIFDRYSVSCYKYAKDGEDILLIALSLMIVMEVMANNPPENIKLRVLNGN